MKLFIDTGLVAEVEEIAAWGVLSGATTNPSLLAKADGDPGDIIRRICDLVDGPTSAEVVATDAEGMITEGRALAGLHDHVVVKVPFSPAGLQATRELTSDGIRVNMTLVFSAAQAILTAEAGATYVSCFMGRVDDIAVDATAVLARDRRRAARQRGPGAGRLAAPSDARGHRGHARLRRVDRSPPRCSSRCSSTRSPRRGSTSSPPTGSRTRASRSGSPGWSRARRRPRA